MYRNILIISDNPGLAGEFEIIIKDKKFDRSTFTFGISPFSSKSDFEHVLTSEIEVFDLKDPKHVEFITTTFDLVFSVHCKQFFPKSLVDTVKCINIHPGYNPVNRGWYPQVFAIIEGLPIGATIHEINNQLDHGSIIARDFVPQYNWDTSEDLYRRVIKKEIELLNNNLEDILKKKYTAVDPEGEGNVFLKKDFNDLLRIDLEEIGTYKTFIDRLRALTHGEYRNAFFVDPESGKKIYLKLSLSLQKENKI